MYYYLVLKQYQVKQYFYIVADHWSINIPYIIFLYYQKTPSLNIMIMISTLIGILNNQTNYCVE